MGSQYDDDDYYDDDYYAPNSARKNPRTWMVSLSLATILALVVIGDTIGALVNVNNRTHIEFGQGTTLAIPCDSSITVKPVATYKENGADKTFLFDSLFVSGLSDQCLNKLFQLKFYSLSGPPLIIGYKNIVGATKYDADVVRFLLSRKLVTDPYYSGLNWYTYPEATGLGSPPAPPNNNGTDDPILCGGDNNSTDVINFDWGIENPIPGCPSDNYLIHFQGFLNIPGTDDGNLNSVTLTLKSYGNTELWFDGGRTLSDNETHDTLTSKNTTISVRKGQSYLIDYWTFKATGKASAKLYWNLDSSGNQSATSVIIPADVMYTKSQDIIEIAPTEGSTDYSIEAISNATNDRSVKITFPRAIDAGILKFFTIETF